MNFKWDINYANKVILHTNVNHHGWDITFCGKNGCLFGSWNLIGPKWYIIKTTNTNDGIIQKAAVRIILKGKYTKDKEGLSK